MKKGREWGVAIEKFLPYGLITVYAIALSYLATLRYEAYTDAWDFGGFVQSISNAVHGGFFLQTIDAYFAKGFPETEVISFMGLHFSPILYLLVPVYAAFPYPPTLLVVETVVIAAGGLPVYWLAKKRLGVAAGVVFLVVYLTYAPLISANLDDFHPESFLSTFLLYAIYFGLDKRWKPMLPFVVLTLSVIEEGGFLVASVALFLFIYFRAWRDGKLTTILVALMGVSIVYSVIATQIPQYFGLNDTGFTQTLNSQNYSILGASSALGLPGALVHSPQKILQALSYELQYKVAFVIELIGPVALLPVFFPEALVMALPWLATAFFSNYSGYYTIYGFYAAFIAFSVFPAAILGLERIKVRSPRISPRVLKGYLGALLVVALIFSTFQAFPSSVYGNSFTVTQQNAVENQILGLLPANASVLTTSDIFPHVANRLDAYTIPPSSLRAGYSTIDEQILAHVDPKYILLNMGSEDGIVVSETDAILAAKVFNGSYGVVGYSHKIILLEQGYTGQPLIYDNPLVYNSTNLVYDTRTTSIGPNDTLVFSQGNDWVNMWFGPYTFLPAGNYTATFSLRLAGSLPANAHVLTIDADYGDLVTVASKDLTAGDFNSSGWQTFTLNFDLQHAVVDLQLRGMYPTNATTIYLQSISVKLG